MLLITFVSVNPVCIDFIHSSFICTYLMLLITFVPVKPACVICLCRRGSCSSCIASKDECAWCENTATCLPFSDYVTRYLLGQCTGWVDSENSQSMCHDCAAFDTCKTCLKNFRCGWCYNAQNPTIGYCVDGDFTGVYCNHVQFDSASGLQLVISLSLLATVTVGISRVCIVTMSSLYSASGLQLSISLILIVAVSVGISQVSCDLVISYSVCRNFTWLQYRESSDPNLCE